MPRPRKHVPRWIALAAVCVAVPPPALHAALAAAAGTLFEAAPFVLAATMPAGPRFRRVARLAGCGCDGRGPGALGLPAIALCWFAFGPLVAVLRAAAALGVAAIRLRRERADAPAAPCSAPASASAPDPLAELAALTPQVLAAALLAQWLPAALPLAGVSPPLANIAALTLGATLGLLLPCATGAVGIAAALRHAAPFASVGLLATAGIAVLRPGVAGPRRSPVTAERHSGRVGFLALALACGTLALRGPSGFVNPRFIFPLGVTAVVAGWYGLRGRTTTARGTGLVPAALLAVTLSGSPLPSRHPAETTLDDPYPGRAVEFLGAMASGTRHRAADAAISAGPSGAFAAISADTAHGGAAAAGMRPGTPIATPLGAPNAAPRPGVGATLLRYTITCCRADAEALVVRLDRDLPGPPGRWYDVSGMLVRDPSGALVLHPTGVRAVRPPADPFAYR